VDPAPPLMRIFRTAITAIPFGAMGNLQQAFLSVQQDIVDGWEWTSVLDIGIARVALSALLIMIVLLGICLMSLLAVATGLNW